MYENIGTDMSPEDYTSKDIGSMLPALKPFYGNKYMPKSATKKKARKTAAEKIMKDMEKMRKEKKKS